MVDRKDRSESLPYEVGYRKPPVATQFQPGNPGRRKGSAKPKNAMSIDEIVRAFVKKKVRVKRGTGTVELAVAEVIVSRLQHMAIQGSAKDLKVLLDLIARHVPEQPLDLKPLEIIHRRASGSSVAAPPADLWQEPEE